MGLPKMLQIQQRSACFMCMDTVCWSHDGVPGRVCGNGTCGSPLMLLQAELAVGSGSSRQHVFDLRPLDAGP